MTTGTARRERALVIGAGIAGLAAARVLAERFDQVLVVDRETLPDGPVPRRGVPQGPHGHVLLAAGQQALEEMFPGLYDDLVRAGATPIDPGVDMCVYRYGAVWSRVPTGLRVVSLSRPLLEWTLRVRVTALPNVEIRTGVAVSGLRATSGRVTAVVLDGGEVVPTDLVVDCSGRGGRSNAWLADLGFPAPEVLEVRVGVGYATRLYRRRAGDLAGWAGAFVLPTPPAEKRVGVALPIEGDRWLVSLGGWHGEHAGTDDAGFVAHARRLPHPVIADLLTDLEPLGPIRTYQFPASRRRLFERLPSLPAGYIAAGDAICSFNPVYGQGMTCAALQAQALARTLDRHGDASADMARAFYRAAAAVVGTPWRFAVGGDFGFPETYGARPPAIGLINRYSRRLQLASMTSPDVRRAFVGVQQLVTPPRVLWRPGMVGRVLLSTMTPRTALHGSPRG